jgi:hypothetical protein
MTKDFAALDARAHAAGMAAGEAATPTPMVVVERADPFDDTSPVTRRYAPVMDGMCGTAYVKVRPGNSAFARYLKASRGAFKAYGGGVQFSVRAFGQSFERSMAYAMAYVEVVRDALPELGVYTDSWVN